eukprot:UN34775
MHVNIEEVVELGLKREYANVDKNGDIKTKKILLVLYMAWIKHFTAQEWFNKMYKPWFGNIVYYADYNYCFNRQAHFRCDGPPIPENEDVLLALKGLPEEWSWDSEEKRILLKNGDPQLYLVNCGGGWN